MKKLYCNMLYTLKDKYTFVREMNKPEMVNGVPFITFKYKLIKNNNRVLNKDIIEYAVKRKIKTYKEYEETRLNYYRRLLYKRNKLPLRIRFITKDNWFV